MAEGSNSNDKDLGSIERGFLVDLVEDCLDICLTVADTVGPRVGIKGMWMVGMPDLWMTAQKAANMVG